MPDPVLAQLTALKSAPIAALKQKWRDLFEREPPPYNRRFLGNRLAYRIQELAHGGLKPEPSPLWPRVGQRNPAKFGAGRSERNCLQLIGAELGPAPDLGSLGLFGAAPRSAA